jgi:hypothetical protein
LWIKPSWFKSGIPGQIYQQWVATIGVIISDVAGRAQASQQSAENADCETKPEVNNHAAQRHPAQTGSHCGDKTSHARGLHQQRRERRQHIALRKRAKRPVRRVQGERQHEQAFWKENPQIDGARSTMLRDLDIGSTDRSRQIIRFEIRNKPASST